MTDEKINTMKKLTREHTHEIWQIAKSGELDILTGEDRRYAEAMLEHKDEYFNEFEMADLTYDYQYDPDTEENPFLHITFHVVVENQLADKDPIEVLQFYNSMRKKKYPHHDTIHLIGAILAPFVFGTLQNKTPADMKKYRSILKKYKDRKPERIWALLEKDSDLDSVFQGEL